jgi:site-specific DNA-methyltransferase (adenine-specific)
MTDLFLGDCLVEMRAIPDKSVNLVLCDPPYGTTRCKWDAVIPLGLMWQQLNRVAKERAAMVFTAGQPFTSVLIASNLKNFKYTWVWDKVTARGHLNAKKQPMRQHEDIPVFYRKQPVYNPQMTKRDKPEFASERGTNRKSSEIYNQTNRNYVGRMLDAKYPKTILTFSGAMSGKNRHPTEKPVALMEYLIRTYSDPGDVVLDFAMGSGTTGAACAATQREFIGIEKNAYWFGRAQDRIEKAQWDGVQLSLLEA